MTYKDTWFRFLVKQIATDDTSHHPYEWYEMAFFASWTPHKASILFCFDVPQALQAHLTETLLFSNDWNTTSIYSLHTVVIDGVSTLYDHAVWAVRDVVRNIEVVSISASEHQTKLSDEASPESCKEAFQSGARFPFAP